MPVAAVLDVARELVRIRRADARRVAVRAAPAGEQADARRAFVLDDVIARSRADISACRRRRRGPAVRAARRDRAARPGTAARRDRASHDRLADRVGGAVGVGDRAVEQADAVVALEIRRVRQHEIGERDRLRRVRVDIDDVRDPVFAGRRVACRSASAASRRVHRRVPAHVRHEQEQRVDADTGSPAQALRITLCSMPCAANGCSHENALSMRRGVPSASTSRSSGACT